MKDKNTEWSCYYHFPHMRQLEVLHARFVDHRYVRHTHDYFVVALVETGAASYWYRGAQRVAGRGQVFVVNPDEPHTGDSATPDGYIYRVLYPRTELLTDLVADAGRLTRHRSSPIQYYVMITWPVSFLCFIRNLPTGLWQPNANRFFGVR